jgi:antitoxin (DNA-binding transcriptional repressor) of toxin-antitoxin stability system
MSGEEVFIVKNGQQAVQLMPVALPQRHPEFGSDKGLIVIADDFDAPLEDFKEYMA